MQQLQQQQSSKCPNNRFDTSHQGFSYCHNMRCIWYHGDSAVDEQWALWVITQLHSSSIIWPVGTWRRVSVSKHPIPRRKWTYHGFSSAGWMSASTNHQGSFLRFSTLKPFAPNSVGWISVLKYSHSHWRVWASISTERATERAIL